MKILALTNWSLIGCYAVLIAYLTLNQSGTDAAGRGLAVGYLFAGAILLVAVLGLNLLPFPATKIAVLVALLVPAALSLRTWAYVFSYTHRTEKDNQGRWDGSYYFKDPDQRRIAEAIAANDLPHLKALLSGPHPRLNESGEEHTTLLDFAALRAAGRPEEPFRVEALALLLAKGATFETADSLHTPTHVLVARQGPAALLAWFLKHGADANAKHRQNQNLPVLLVVLDDPTERLEKVRLLLAHGADPNVVYPPADYGWLVGHSVLLAAARQDLWEICQVLLEQGADPAFVGPRQLVFRELLTKRATVYAETGTTPPAFTGLQKVRENLPGKKP
ncbi:ankyrin repeat domain-containing protein [Larkinella humicola]|uniref:Ankyrin repeat domain-containing protein n=1 Tax=Larkinella humicola TaxID=2607654 RepID=A0A5N1J7E9_9BACT|nr:ankyrin repeat domain-containing protein [Larkinella humicola]KAA9346711.1 ankyrin repeat domain-containing protein [Larkinella humicola]